MRNLHNYLLENHGREALQQFKDWERFKLRDCNDRNHRIFTLKCISNQVVPVSIRLKTTIKNRELGKSSEKDLLQAWVKSINSILGDKAKQIEQSWSKLASLVLNSTMEKCKEFIEKVSELRFIKIKERQVNKFNKLIQKQGNITWFSAVPSAGNPQANNSSASPVRSQAPQAQAGTDTQAISTSHCFPS